MRIATVHGKQPADRSRAAKRTSAGGKAFSQCLAEAAAADGASPPATTGVSAMETLFSIRQVDTATDRRSRGQAVRRADILLDHLSDIQADLLAGAVPADRLQTLAKMLRGQRESVDDPRLKDLIDEIELRAEVELAKFGTSE